MEKNLGQLTKRKAASDAGGVKRSANHAEVHRLVKDALDTASVWTDKERDLVVQHVEGAWFDTRKMVKVTREIAGLKWDGRILNLGDTVSTDAAHYLKHVVARKEWPTGTSMEGYKASIRRVVGAPNSAIAVSYYRGQAQVTFFGHSGLDEGDDGAEYIMIDYRVGDDGIRTSYQPAKGTDIMLERDRKSAVWVREPAR